MQSEIIRLLLLLAIFGATMLAVEGGVGWFTATRRQKRRLAQRLGAIEKGRAINPAQIGLRRRLRAPLLQGTPLASWGRNLDRLILESGVTHSSQRVLATLAAAVATIFGATVLFAMARNFPLSAGGLTLIALFAGAVGFAAPLFVLANRRDRRRKLITEQFPIALDTVVRGLRAGHPVAASLDLLMTDLDQPLAGEFVTAIHEVTYGLDLRDALQNMADRCGVDEIQMFVVALSIQSETGGNLAEILEGLARVIRDRTAMMLKVRSLSSEGRITAAMLTGLPILVFSALFALNPGFYLDVADDPAFFMGFGILGALYIVGFIAIRRMIDLKV